MDDDIVPPSSPPHASTAYIPSSPFLAPQYEALSPKSSSPPPLFSSDDSRESVDITNYESPRIYKNKRKGAWWDLGESTPHTTPEPKKTKMSRNFDSGVYMMSDATDSSESLMPQHKSPFGLDATCDSSTIWHEETSICIQPQPSQQEKEFNTIIADGLENNREVYDFSEMNLQDSDIRHIGNLASVIKAAPDPGDELPVEGQYRSMMPELYVSLRSNHLCRLTPSLFHLQNLTTLILTDNNIEELPAQIGQLRNLKELNMSRNNIRWLPFDILPILSNIVKGDSGVPWLKPKPIQFHPLTSLGLSDSRPDRFDVGHITDIEKFDRDFPCRLKRLCRENGTRNRSDRDNRIWKLRVHELQLYDYKIRAHSEEAVCVRDGAFPHHPQMFHYKQEVYRRHVYLARTPVSYFDQAGVLCKNSPIPPASDEDVYHVMTELDDGVHGIPSTWFAPPRFHCPRSLVELSLDTALRQKEQESLSIDDLRSYIEPIPHQAKMILDRAEANALGGYRDFKQCHTCKKDYIVPRAEWIEWWSGLWGEKAIPLKVQVCSWGCVPVGMRTRPEKEFNWESAAICPAWCECHTRYAESGYEEW